MKALKIALAVVVLLLGAMADTASAHGRRHFHSSIGLHIGVPLGYWGGYYPPPYYYPPPVVVNTPPPVYIERSSPDGDAPGSLDYWYRCDNPSGYWPYIRQCPGGWEKVVPSAPPR